MNFRHGFLFGYRLLLWLYPPAFRARYAPEMLELAEAVGYSEWPLFFCDTGIAIVRCWFEGTHSAAIVVEPNPYLSLDQSPVRPSRILQGMVLFVAILGGLIYINHRWPPACPLTRYPNASAPADTIPR